MADDDVDGKPAAAGVMPVASDDSVGAVAALAADEGVAAVAANGEVFVAPASGDRPVGGVGVTTRAASL
jgi:hypothetical protein